MWRSTSQLAETLPVLREAAAQELQQALCGGGTGNDRGVHHGLTISFVELVELQDYFKGVESNMKVIRIASFSRLLVIIRGGIWRHWNSRFFQKSSSGATVFPALWK